MQASLKEENYLKALIKLSNMHGTVGVKQLSETLQLTMPTINAMMKKFHQKGWVIYETYKPLQITDRGRTLGLNIIRKHRLTEMFLVQIMGIGWESVHEIAEQIEHLDSPLFFDKMDELLGYPTWDPHGSPIPNAAGDMPSQAAFPMSSCDVGDRVILTAVKSEHHAFLDYLNDKKIKLNDAFQILSVEKYDGSVSVLHQGLTIHFSKQVADQLWVNINKQ